MFYYIEGRVALTEPGLLVLDCGGVGYELRVSAYTLSAAQPGKTFRAYTRLNVREDAAELYGFSSLAEKNFFLMLTDVSGVGPKAAMSILSSATPERLAAGIVSGDERLLTSAPGVGKKLAQRVILELKDKISKSLPDLASAQTSAGVAASGSASEAVGALMVLGYSRADAETAVSRVSTENLTVEQIIRLALRSIE